MLSAACLNVACCSVYGVGRATLRVARKLRGILKPPATPRCAQDVCPEEEGEPAVPQEQADGGRGPDGTVGTQSPLTPPSVEGGPSAFAPWPRPLPGTLQASESSGGTDPPECHASVLRSFPQRNALTSSYSSTRGLQPVPGPRAAATSRAARRRQKSSKKASQNGPPSSTPAVAAALPVAAGAPAAELTTTAQAEAPAAARATAAPAEAPATAAGLSQRTSQPAEDVDAAQGHKRTRRHDSPTSDGARPRKRKVSLLPRQRQEPLRLPPTPELGSESPQNS